MGNQQQPQPSTSFGSSPFGTNQNAQGGTGLFGNSPPTSNSPFGGNNTQQNTGFLGNPQQQQNSNQGGSLFGTFAPSNNQQQGQTSSLFGQSNPQQQNNSGFGTTSIALGAGNNNNNKLGGTSWGVPTNQQQPSGTQNIQPVRSKNPKLDAKHLVKCIAALDQFQGCCKEEIRINYIQCGGQQPSITQQQAQGSAGFAKPPNSPLTTTPSFGVSQGNTGGFLSQGQNQNTGGSLFGAKPAGQQGGSLFGASQQPVQNQGGFGQTGGSLFGQQQQQQQQTSAFGQQGGSLFGSPSGFAGNQTQQPQGGSLFGQQQQQQQPSLFGASQPAQSSLFGAQPQPSTPFFGGTQTSSPLQAPPSLFTTAGSAPTQSNPSLFGATPQMTPGTPQYGQQYGQQSTPSNLMNTGNFAQMAAPLFQAPQQQMDPSMQLLLPQLLINALATQHQNQNQTGTAQPNPTLDLVNKMISNLAVTKAAEHNNLFGSASQTNFLSPTPFDDFLKE